MSSCLWHNAAFFSEHIVSGKVFCRKNLLNIAFFKLLLLCFLACEDSRAQGVTEIPSLRARARSFAESSYGQEVQAKQFSRDLSEEILSLPNLNRAGGSQRSRFFQIRGVGDRGQFEHSQVNPVGVFYEGIDLSEEASVLPLLGRERLTVAYGPQTQIWGSKAIAGSIDVKNCLGDCDTFEWGGEIESYDTRSLFFNTSQPLGRSSIAVGAKILESDGAYHNTYLNRPTHTHDEKTMVVGAQHSFGAWNLRHFHLLVDHNNGYDAWTFNGSFDTLSDHPGLDRHLVHGHSLLLEPEASRGLWSMTSVTSTQQLESYDEDWGNNSYWQSVGGWNQDYNYYSAFERDRLKLHQKLGYRWSESLETGVHYYLYGEKQKIRSYKDEALRRFVEPEVSSHQAAAWLSKNWRWDKFEVLTSMRGERQSSDLTNSSAARESRRFLLWGAKAELLQFLRDGLQLSYVLERAYRGGGYNTDPNLTASQRPFGSESLYHTQVGAQWENQNSSLLLRAFSYWYEDQQVRSSVQTDPMDPSTFSYFTSNVGRSQIYGLELITDLEWRNWRAHLNAGLLEAKYQSYNLAGRNLKGRALPHAPRWNYQLGLQYALGSVVLQTQYQAMADFYFSEDHDKKAESYGTLEASIRITYQNWQWSLWGKNLLDKSYAVRGYHFANEPPDWEEKLYIQRGPPQSFGLGVLVRL